jgi:hypothetical protein
MADATLLRKAGMKVVFLVLVVGLGRWALWPDIPVREWMEDNSGWQMKFAFIAWVAVALGMTYDAFMALVRGAIATPEGAKRR